MFFGSSRKLFNNQIYFFTMTIYVGNLSHKASEDDLSNLFSQFGAVKSAKIIMDKFTGRSRGFAFVEMEEDSASEAAISALHEQEFMTRPLTVNEAKPREEGDRPQFNRNRGGGGGGGGGYNRGGGGGNNGGGGGYNRERRDNY